MTRMYRATPATPLPPRRMLPSAGDGHATDPVGAPAGAAVTGVTVTIPGMPGTLGRRLQCTNVERPSFLNEAPGRFSSPDEVDGHRGFPGRQSAWTHLVGETHDHRNCEVVQRRQGLWIHRSRGRQRGRVRAL